MKVVTFSLSALLAAPTRNNHVFMLHFLEQAGVELRCYSPASRRATKYALARMGLLAYFDDLLWAKPRNGLVIDRPKLANYTSCARRLGLPRQPLLSYLDRRLTKRLHSSSASTTQNEDHQ